MNISSSSLLIHYPNMWLKGCEIHSDAIIRSIISEQSIPAVSEFSLNQALLRLGTKPMIVNYKRKH